MDRTYKVITAYRAKLLGLRPERSFGYYIQITPPIESMKTGEDVEGVGWCPMTPTKQYQNFHGWYKRKALAIKRLAELEAS